MAMLVLLLLLSVSVKQDNASLRNGCDADSDAIAALPAGTAVTIRYALSGQSTPCYKVSAEASGKTFEGFLPASAMEGMEEFEHGVRDAPWLGLSEVMSAVRPSLSLGGAAGGKAGANPASFLSTAEGLIESSQPAKALELLEPRARNSTDPQVLALAGAAAWRADDPKKALLYWRASLDLQPNPSLEDLYRRVQRETAGDQSGEKLFGARVVLRYEAASIPADTARQMLAALDQEYARISTELGCQAEERIVAIAQSPAAYRKTTDAAEWNGGQFDGRIRVPVAPGQVLDAALRRALAHETTHACLTMLGHWPSWVQEGLAQKLSGDAVTPTLRAKLAAWAKEGKLPRLSNLRQDWSRLDTEHATAAYGLSLEAVELLYQGVGMDGVRNLLRSPERLGSITADLDRRLGL
jgi:hypothetical protein